MSSEKSKFRRPSEDEISLAELLRRVRATVRALGGHADDQRDPLEGLADDVLID